MNLNIALNTIIYIMVFLFPGVLFRKFYFTAKHKSQFYQGQLFERFLTTIILSILCLFVYTLLFEYLLSDILGLRLVNKIPYEDFLSLFKHLGKNEVPKILDEKDKFIDFIFLLFTVYVTAATFGTVSYKIIIFLGLDKNISFLRFNNEWDYLFSAPSKDIKKKKSGKIIYTNIDILTMINSKETLYQGGLYKVLYDKDHDLEGLAIRNAQKFLVLDKIDEIETINYINNSINNGELIYTKYRETSKLVTYIKAIDSDVFVINKNEIINYNILYLTKRRSPNVLYIKKAVLFTSILTTLPLSVLIFVSLEISYFDTFWKRLLFSLYTFFQLAIINGVINNIFIRRKEIISNLLIIGFTGVFYLWFFEFTSFIMTTIIGFILLVLVFFFSDSNDE